MTDAIHRAAKLGNLFLLQTLVILLIVRFLLEIRRNRRFLERPTHLKSLDPSDLDPYFVHIYIYFFLEMSTSTDTGYIRYLKNTRFGTDVVRGSSIELPRPPRGEVRSVLSKSTN